MIGKMWQREIQSHDSGIIGIGIAVEGGGKAREVEPREQDDVGSSSLVTLSVSVVF